MDNLDKRIRKLYLDSVKEVIDSLSTELVDKDFVIYFPEFSHIVGKLYERAEEKDIYKGNGLFTLLNYFDDITYSIAELVINGESEYFKECITYLELDITKFSKLIDNSENLWEHITLNDIMYIKTTHLKRIYKDNSIECYFGLGDNNG